MKKTRHNYLRFSRVIYTLITLTGITLTSCNLFSEADKFDYSGYDALWGIEESGQIKKEIHYTSSDDPTPNSEVDFYYNENNRLISKIYIDYLGGYETFVLQKDTFIYQNDKLKKMIHYFREGITTSPLALDEITDYFYPEPNTEIAVRYNDVGEFRDSVIYIYSDNLLIYEKHIDDDGFWEMTYEYNPEGKLLVITDVNTRSTQKNIFDNHGILIKSEGWVNNELKSEVFYRHDETGNQLIINIYNKHLGDLEEFHTSRMTFIDGKYYEYIRFHPTFPGSQWWCNRFEYY